MYKFIKLFVTHN